MIKTQGAKIFAAWSHRKNEKWIKKSLKNTRKSIFEPYKKADILFWQTARV